MSADAGVERARKMQRVINACHRVFASAEGKLVLAHLNEMFGTKLTAFLPREGGGYDPLHAAMRDGQRSVLLRIEEYLKVPVVGDDNVTEPKMKVIKQ